MTEKTTPETAAPEIKPRRRWIKVALLVSLVFNLLFVGLFVGAAAGRHRFIEHDGRSDARILQQLGPYGRALPEDRRHDMIQAMRPTKAESLRARQELRHGFRQILTLLRTEPFEDEAYGRLLVEQQSLIENRISAGQAALMQQLRQMTPEERRTYADTLEKVLRRGPGGDKPH